MTGLLDLLEAPDLRARLRHLAGPLGNRPVGGVTLAEDLDRLGQASAGAVVVLTEAASRAAAGYHLDMALRLGRAGGAAAVVLTDGRSSVPPTAATIATRADLTVLAAPAGTDLAGLLLAVGRELTGGAESALARLTGVLAALRAAEDGGQSPDRLLQAARAAFGDDLEERPPGEDDVAVPVVIDGEPEGTLCVIRRSPYDDVVAEAVARLAAAGMARAHGLARQPEEVPVRSRGELLTEFLFAGPARADRLLERLRAAGVAIDGWHAVIRIEVEGHTGA